MEMTPFGGTFGSFGGLGYVATSGAKSDVIFLLGDPDFLLGRRNFAPISLSWGFLGVFGATRLPELTQNVIWSSHGHSTPSLKFHGMLLTYLLTYLYWLSWCRIDSGRERKSRTNNAAELGEVDRSHYELDEDEMKGDRVAAAGERAYSDVRQSDAMPRYIYPQLPATAAGVYDN